MVVYPKLNVIKTHQEVDGFIIIMVETQMSNHGNILYSTGQ